MITRTAVAVLLFILFFQASCKKDELLRETIIDEPYGNDERNKMDVFLPLTRDSTTETVVLLHGGGWVAGDKSDFSGSAIISPLLRAGYAIASINYRYACGDYRKQMEDIDKAIYHLRMKAAMWKISGQRFALAGGSAGGHLALLFSYAFDSEHLIKAVVSLAGPTDLTDTSFHRCAANYRIDYVFRQLLGNDYRDNPALYREASPLFRPDSVPTLLIYGKLDDLVPFAQGLRLFEALSSYGFPADTLFYENAGHNVLGDKNRNASEISARMNRWLKLHLDKN